MTRRASIKSRSKQTVAGSGDRDVLHDSRRFGASTFYETPSSAATWSKSTTVNTATADQRLNVRLYRKNSGTASRSVGRRSSAVRRTSSRKRRGWRRPSLFQSGLIQGEWLSADDRTAVDLDSDKTSGVSGSDSDARSKEQLLGSEVSPQRRPSRRTRLSEHTTSAAVCPWTAESSSEFGLGHVDDGSASGVGTVRGKGDLQSQASAVKLKRHVGLSGTEAENRRATWALKRLQASAQDRDRGVGHSAVEFHPDDCQTSCEEHLPTTGRGVGQRLPCSPVYSQVDLSPQTISDAQQGFEDCCQTSGDVAELVSAVEPDGEMSELTDVAVVDSGTLTANRQVVAAVPRRLSSETNADNHDDCSGDRNGVWTSLLPQSPPASVTGVAAVSTAVSLIDSLYETDRQVSTADTFVNEEPDVLGHVTAFNRRQSSLDADGKRVRFNSGTYRTSCGHDEVKSEPSLVCSPGAVRFLRDLFERTPSPSVTKSPPSSPAVADTGSVSDAVFCSYETLAASSDAGGQPVGRSASSDQLATSSPELLQHVTLLSHRPPPDRIDHESDCTTPAAVERLSSLSCDAGVQPVGGSASSDQLATSSPELLQHVTLLTHRPPPDRVDHESDCTAPAAVDRLSSLSNDDGEVGPDSLDRFRLRRTSSVEDDLQRRRYCCTVARSSYEEDRDRPHRTRSYDDLLRCDVIAVDDSSSHLGDVGRTQSRKRLVMVDTRSGELAESSECFIAWHRPDQPEPRPPAGTPVSGPTPDGRGTQPAHLYRHVTDLCGSVQTIEIARHKPE